MANSDIRIYAREKGVNLWQVSESLGYAHETAFSRVLRRELPNNKKKEIKAIIDSLSSNKADITKKCYMPFLRGRSFE